MAAEQQSPNSNCSQPSWRNFIVLQTGTPKVLNFLSNCLPSCCFSSLKGKNRAQWIRKCRALFSLIRGVSWHCFVFLGLPGPSLYFSIVREGRTKEAGWVIPGNAGHWEVIGKQHWFRHDECGEGEWLNVYPCDSTCRQKNLDRLGTSGWNWCILSDSNQLSLKKKNKTI